MAKTIRFAQLVKTSGRPHVATLWGDPKKDPAFGRAIRENRILTVKQTPAAHKKDSGTIGFVEEKNVSYLVFPEPLPENKDALVIGIKYDLLDAGEPVGGKVEVDGKKAKPPKPKKPALKTFAVTIKRTATIEASQTVQAATADKARSAALAAIRETPFELADALIHDEVRAVDEESKHDTSD